MSFDYYYGEQSESFRFLARLPAAVYRPAVSRPVHRCQAAIQPNVETQYATYPPVMTGMTGRGAYLSTTL